MQAHDAQPGFGLGPAWAWDTQCCGKPVGCTNVSSQCRMQGHLWKRWHARLVQHEEACPACAQGQPCDERGKLLSAS